MTHFKRKWQCKSHKEGIVKELKKLLREVEKEGT